MSTITKEQQDSIAAYVSTHHIPSGLGTKEAACSIAAINLALIGTLTDDIPGCMSKVIGAWIIQVQDSMPDSLRNSAEWKSLLPLAAGTGREHESERLDIVMTWMWETVLPTLQPLADEEGFGTEWATMLRERTFTAGDAAQYAADASAAASAAAYAGAAASAAAYAGDAASAARYAGDAAYAAQYAADAAASAYAWQEFDPAGLLARLVAVTHTNQED